MIKKIITANVINLEKFKEKLLKLGYSVEAEDLYSEIRFQPIEFQIIPVDSKFPRINANSLLGIDPAARIKDIDYVVNIAGLETQRHPQINLVNFEQLL